MTGRKSYKKGKMIRFGETIKIPGFHHPEPPRGKITKKVSPTNWPSSSEFVRKDSWPQRPEYHTSRLRGQNGKNRTARWRRANDFSILTERILMTH